MMERGRGRASKVTARSPQEIARTRRGGTAPHPRTYCGDLEQSPASRVELGGFEGGAVLRVRFPSDLSLPSRTTVDICLVLKEPTLAVDFSAELSGDMGVEGCLGVIAKSIMTNAALLGEPVHAGVARNDATGEHELYVTKPYLENGMFVVHFGKGA
ncbi:hypothetical protein [Streptomyces sp. NPDC056361]|uniref:hypothetical protein n=1 Tax=Streptomyces sp. NPDC056361 TaxID=3345795 RepID=UPI0035E23CA5